MNLHCDKVNCSNNTCFEKSCMYGISADMIRNAKSGNSMCEHLRKSILELEKLFCKELTDRIVERLEEEKTDLTTWAEDMAFKIGIDKAIKIVKEEGGLNDNRKSHQAVN